MPYDEGMSDREMRKAREGARERGKKWLARCKEAFNRQKQWLDYWQGIAELFYPERADFNTQVADAEERIGGIYSIEPQLMRRNMQNRLGALVRPRGQDWFSMVVRPDELMEQHSIKTWCSKQTRTQRAIVYDPRAQFTRAMSESDGDYVAFGNSVVAHTYNHDRSGMLFKNKMLRNCAWFENDIGIVDELYEEIEERIEDFAKLFGKKVLPKDWRKALEKTTTAMQKRKIKRVVAPIRMYDGPMSVPQGMEFFSLYMVEGERDDEVIIAEGFFASFPYTVRRWQTVSNEPYGRSPCTQLALPEGRELNVLENTLGRGIEWAIDPPRTAQHGAIVGDIRIEAGGITMLDDDYDTRTGRPLEALQIGDPRYGMEYRNLKQHTIGRAFWEELMTLPDREMTAYEAGKRLEQTVRDAAPIFEPMEAENAHMMEAVFTRAMRQGAFGALLEDGTPEGMPEEIQGREIRFDFVTPLTRARKELKAEKFRAMMADVGGLLASQDPRLLEMVDHICLLYTSPSPRDQRGSRMPSSA